MGFRRTVRGKTACGRNVVSLLQVALMVVLVTCATLALCQPSPTKADSDPHDAPQPPSHPAALPPSPPLPPPPHLPPSTLHPRHPRQPGGQERSRGQESQDGLDQGHPRSQQGHTAEERSPDQLNEGHIVNQERSPPTAEGQGHTAHEGQNQGQVGQDQGHASQNQDHSGKNQSPRGQDQDQTSLNQGHIGQNQGHTGQNQGHTGQNQGHTGQNQGHTGQNQGHTDQNQGHTGQNQGHAIQDQGGQDFEGQVRADDGDGDGGGGGVVLVTLGWGEDEAVTSAMASLLRHHNHHVTVIAYGSRTSAYSSDVKVVEVAVAEDDPMFPGGVGLGVTPEELGAEGRGWAVVSGRVARSRVCACRQLNREARVKEVVSRAHLLVTPLFLHDLCTLTLAKSAGVAAVGVVTSRVGAWWAWHHLDLLPPLATTAVPPGTMVDLSIWSRAANLAAHYGYLTAVRQAWQVPAATTSLPAGEAGGDNLASLYSGLAGVLVAWDPLLDPSIPNHPAVVPVGGINLQPGLMAKEVLVPALMNRAGVVTVSVGGGMEAWVGPGTQAALHHALQATSYTILWRGAPPEEQPPPPTVQPKFVYNAHIPLGDVLNHPRHRLLVSACGETEAMAAVYFGSPVLCLPVTPDQHLASAALQTLGLGEVVPAAEVTADKLKAALHKLTGERRYRERGREWGEELHDQALSPDDRLLYTLERIMRRPHSNTYLRRPEGAPQLYLLQQSNADVYLLLLLLLTTLLGLLFYLALALLPVLLAKRKHKKD